MEESTTLSVADVGLDCLKLVAFGLNHLERNEHAAAGQALAAAWNAANQLPPNEGRQVGALVLYSLSRLCASTKRVKEAGETRAQATAILDQAGEPDPLPSSWTLFPVLMSDVLVALGEYRRAIPYCEAAIRNGTEEMEGPAGTAAVLWRAGKCYVRIGLKDHAAVPLRAAVKCYRMMAGDPRLPAALLDLGNALRKSAPAEAERCYQEAADMYESRGQMESAAAAWVNLGVLCGEQRRNAESLAHYEKALHVRQMSPRTPPERLGTAWNNIANAQRRLGRFEEALASVKRAQKLLEPVGGYYLACAYGTQGLIYRDWGRDKDCVEWFRKSAAEHRKQPSPNLETLCEELENEAAALERLGRQEEARTARASLDSVRAAMAAVAPAGDLGDLKLPAAAAVLIEIDSDGRQDALAGKSGSIALADRLTDILETEDLAYSGGRVFIPEATTLIFYGSDAEAMFQALHPVLLQELMCAGARVTVRQGDQHREIVLPSRVN